MTTSTARYVPTDKRPLVTFKDRHLRESWPKADSARCHLFEAVNIVGEAMHGDLWTGQELCVVRWDISPDQEAASAGWGQQGRIARGGTPDTVIPSAAGKLVDPETLRQAAALGRRLKQEAWEENLRATRRLTDAVEWLAAECRDGRLHSFVRFQTGGRLFDMQASEWNRDNPLQDFLSGGGFERMFPVGATHQKFPVYIFIDRASLASAVAVFGRASAPVPMADLARLSPYLRLAVTLALENDYTSPDVVDKRSVREAEVSEAWATALPGVPKSENMVRAIASVIGFPDPKAIATGQRRKARRGG